jgi:hypothetical protein
MTKSILRRKWVALLLGAIVLVILVLTGFILANQSTINDKPIHLQSGNSSFDWNKDPAAIDDLAEVSNIVAKVKYTGKSESYKIKGSAVLRTAYTVDVIEVIDGSVPYKQIEIIGWGGKIPLQDYIDNCSEEELKEDLSLSEMSAKAIAASTFEDTDYLGVDFSKNDEAIVFLQHNEETKGRYDIVFGGLGLFEKDDEINEYINKENKTDIDITENAINKIC